MTERSTSELFETLQDSVRDTILAHLKTPAISLSSFESKRTGSRYQAVRLGDQLITGFRSAERHVFAGVNLKGKTVLDLGCNLGEIARDAVRGGAALVHGIEYDPYFVQMARLISAYNQMSNVSFAQGDLTQAQTYSGRYDVVVALSVYTYIKDYLAPIAEMTKELLILETHAAGENWWKQYLKPIEKHFQYVALVGISDHKASSQADLRFLLFCSHKPLDGAMATRARDLATAKDLPTIDLSRSVIRHYDSFIATVGTERSQPLDEHLAAAGDYLRSRPDEEVFDEICRHGLVRSPLYWCHFLAGYGEYRTQGGFAPQNTYYRMLQSLVERGQYDAAFLKVFDQCDGGIGRLSLRFQMIDHLVECPDGALLDPIILYDIVGPEHFGPSGHLFQMFASELGEFVSPLALDGHHRTFVGYLTGAQRVRFVPIWYEHLKAVQIFLARRNKDPSSVWEGAFPYSQKFMRGRSHDSGESQTKELTG